ENVMALLQKLSDQVLLKSLSNIVLSERQITVSLIEHLIEVEKRELHIKLGYTNMFNYLTKAFKYSDGAAGRRLAAVNILKRCPGVKQNIIDGSLSLNSLHRLNFCKDAPEFGALILESVGKSGEELDLLISKFSNKPQPKRKEVVRFIFKKSEDSLPKT